MTPALIEDASFSAARAVEVPGVVVQSPADPDGDCTVWLDLASLRAQLVDGKGDVVECVQLADDAAWVVAASAAYPAKVAEADAAVAASITLAKLHALSTEDQLTAALARIATLEAAVAALQAGKG